MSASLASSGPADSSIAPLVCDRCNCALPLRSAGPGEHAAIWLCANCGIPFPAVCLPELLASQSARVALDDRYFDTSYLPPISPDLLLEIGQLSVSVMENGAKAYSRCSPRVTMALVASAVELDNDFFPISPTFQMMVVNVSTEGIGLAARGSISAPYLAAKLRSTYRAEPIQVVIRIRRQEELKAPFYLIGGEFVVRLGS
ncbi:MAG: hypothetical protein KF688_06950 [Pirellulales bacterium]|nr:hypothetical protein [Pirellulales bacterium]